MSLIKEGEQWVYKDEPVEWMKKRPIFQIEVPMSLTGIPTRNCFLHDTPMEKAMMPYSCGTSIIVRTERAPGYVCLKCNSEDDNSGVELSLITQLRFLEEALKVFIAQRNANAGAISQAIVNKRRLIAQYS